LDLSALGWDDFFAEGFARLRGASWRPARVAIEDKHAYVVWDESGQRPATVTGRLLHQRQCNADLPKVGDWVAIAAADSAGAAVIQAVLPRRTKLARKVPGRRVEEQVLAANLDVAFAVQALDQTFNSRRQERFLLMIREGGARPVVVLNKTDLCEAAEAWLRVAREAAPAVPVLLASARTGRGIAELQDHLRPGETGAFIGPSGVGKSTLINRLYGEDIQATIEVRAVDGKGRHTTTWRELIRLPSGALIIDTPGMREVQMGLGGDHLLEAFPDILDLAATCHFRDCSHTVEKRCAVQAARAAGQLDSGRLASFLKLKHEVDYLAEERKKHTYLVRRRQGRPT
jgi:ribosome biogenesis GTPase